jgi:hypothetical protein
MPVMPGQYYGKILVVIHSAIYNNNYLAVIKRPYVFHMIIKEMIPRKFGKLHNYPTTQLTTANN